jgi:hypothetical protein
LPQCFIQQRKIQDSYSMQWSLLWARQDSNLRPTGYEPGALPLSYEPLILYIYISEAIV